MNTQARIVNGLTGMVALLTLAIGAGAFVISYDALYATGAAHGVPASKAWIWPLLIDTPLVVFTLALLVSQLLRQSAKLWAGLVILYTLATIGFNLSHAQPSPLGWTVAIVAPIGLLLTTEALRHLAKTIIERQAIVSSLSELAAQVDRMRVELSDMLSQKQGELAAKQSELDKLNGQIEAAKAQLAGQIGEISANVQDLNAARQAKIDQRRASVLALLSEGLSPADIAGELNVTVRTIKRDITALNGQVRMTQ